MVVVIIVGILASLAIGNYSRVVERGRLAEAKKIMSNIRQQAFAYYLDNNAFTGSLARLGFGDLPSGACDANNYFRYGVIGGADNFNIWASRCTASGKGPNAPAAYLVQLWANGTLNCSDSNIC
ncbi:MAG: hypothetical protein ABIC68_03860 [Candidatus Omnitrophota bacterium]